MKKKQYVKPQTEKKISIEFPCLSSCTAHPDEPAAKKNYCDTGDEEGDSRNGFTRVGGSANKLWDD